MDARFQADRLGEEEAVVGNWKDKNKDETNVNSCWECENLIEFFGINHLIAWDFMLASARSWINLRQADSAGDVRSWRFFSNVNLGRRHSRTLFKKTV